MVAIADARKRKVIAVWLLLGVFMIVVQIALGGITRLTGSGLSMTEWEPIMGFLPPLNEQEWLEAFEGYQQIAQFKYVNSHFTLSEFKFIYFWEWFHRNWARFIAVVFLVPFIYFWAKKYFLKEMVFPLILLFAIGGLQGFIGWYMVKSGLDESSLFYVSHIRLSVHLVTALGLLAYTLWFSLKLLIPKKKLVHDAGTRNFFLITIGVLVIQLFYGAFMAGLHAAKWAPSWPKMNGYWIPPNFESYSLINHPLGVQFVHRILAYLLLLLVIIGAIKAWKVAKKSGSKLLRNLSIWTVAFILTQVVLGIYTLLAVPSIVKDEFGLYETLAELHQIVAMFLLMALVIIVFLVRGKEKVKSLSV